MRINTANITRPKIYVPLVLLVFLAAFPSLTSNSYVIHLLILMLFFAVLSEAWNILGGYTGQFSVGHAALFGVGAYTSTILFINWKTSPWLGMFVGAGFTVILAVITGFLCFRLRGPFFSLATIAFAEVSRLLFLDLGSLTGGTSGLLVPLLGDSPINFQFLDRRPYYYIIFIMLLGTVYVTYRLRNSKRGLRLMAIREDEDAAQSSGINILRHKLIALAISAFITAMAGTFYAQYILFIHPDSTMSVDFSIQIALPAIVGGMGTISGPVIGAFMLTPISEFTRALLGGGYAGVYLIIYGSVLILTMLLVPGGIAERITKNYDAFLKNLPGGRNHEPVGG